MAKNAIQRADMSTTTNPIVTKIAEKFSVDSESLLSTLKATAFKQSGDNVITNEQMYALLIVSDQYNLNPFTKEIYAFPDKFGGIVPVVSVDGWNRIANEHPHFDGVEFEYSIDVVRPEGAGAHCHAWIETILYRKDRKHPTRVREYLDECYKTPYQDYVTGQVKNGPWQSHPKRMLRHKSEIQCYRVGFGFVGIYDEDEALRIINNDVEQAPQQISKASVVSIQSTRQQTESEMQSHLPAPETEEPFDEKVVDEFVERLCQRAVKTNQWQAAKDLIDERYVGGARTHAQNKLSEQEQLSSNGNGSEQADDESTSQGNVAESTQPEVKTQTSSRKKSNPDKVLSQQNDSNGQNFF